MLWLRRLPDVLTSLPLRGAVLLYVAIRHYAVAAPHLILRLFRYL